MIWYIVLAVSAVIGVIALITSTKPDNWTVQRQGAIPGAPAKVFPYIEDPHKFMEWSPWAKMDPSMKLTERGQCGDPSRQKPFPDYPSTAHRSQLLRQRARPAPIFLLAQRKGLCRADLSRYRFVFLDGCFTAYAHDLFKAFGANSFEFREPGDPSYSPLTINDYKNFNLNKNKVRPSAFLGWKSEVPLAYPLPHQIDNYTWKHYTSRCNWHNMILSFWTLDNQTIKEAVDNANTTASLTFQTGEPAWTTAPVEAPNPTTGLLPASGPNATFSLKFLRIYGASDLKFSTWNSAAETWPPPPP